MSLGFRFRDTHRNKPSLRNFLAGAAPRKPSGDDEIERDAGAFGAAHGETLALPGPR